MATIELTGISIDYRRRSLRRLVGDLSSSLMPTKIDRKKETSTNGKIQRSEFVMENINLIIPDGKTVVLLGPNGCGKTTLLRIIAGLIKPDSGTVRFDGVDMEKTSPGERKIGFMFQSIALYPPLTAKENILSYYIFRKQTPELDRMAKEKFQQTSELLGVDIKYLLHRKPHNLSPGEKQRVSLGRCITREPRVILLDEPFSNLDRPLRVRYRSRLKELLQRYGVTAVYVTHDQQEAMILADLIAIMDIGTIEQVGTYERLYREPVNRFVAEFLNLDADTPAINFVDGVQVSASMSEYLVGFRPESIITDGTEAEFMLEGTVRKFTPIPIKGVSIFTMDVGDKQIVGSVPSNHTMWMGEQVRIGVSEYHLFSRSTNKRIKSVRTDTN